jgi:phosphohistidine phosphatase
MDCVLFRHGIAADQGEWDGPDAKRPLTPRGMEKTAASGEGLARLEIEPSQVWSSSLTRAVQTANILQEIFSFSGAIQIMEDLRPEAAPERVLEALARQPSDACIICVGHQPNLGEVAGVSLFGGPVAGLELKKAGACCIRFSGPVKPGEGVLRWWLAPSQLRLLAKR